MDKPEDNSRTGQLKMTRSPMFVLTALRTIGRHWNVVTRANRGSVHSTPTKRTIDLTSALIRRRATLNHQVMGKQQQQQHRTRSTVNLKLRYN